MRHEAAEALLAACRHNFSDPDIQQHIMEVQTLTPLRASPAPPIVALCFASMTL